MRLHKDFAVSRSREDLSKSLRDPHVVERLFPGVRVESLRGGATEVVAPNPAVPLRELRFSLGAADGELRFERISGDGIWQHFKATVTINEVDRRMSRVRIALEGRPRQSVPEISVRAPLHDQLEQMSRNLRQQLERV